MQLVKKFASPLKILVIAGTLKTKMTHVYPETIHSNLIENRHDVLNVCVRLVGQSIVTTPRSRPRAVTVALKERREGDCEPSYGYQDGAPANRGTTYLGNPTMINTLN